MKELWTECNKDDPNVAHRSPQSGFEGHIFEVKEKLFIIGHPGCPTSMFNENPHSVLNHCTIQDNTSAIIEFNDPALAFTEIFLQYGGKIQINRRINVPAPKAVTDLVLEGNIFRADKPVATKILSVFEKNEKKPFHELQAETTSMPSAKKIKLSTPSPTPASPVPCAQFDSVDQTARKVSGSSSDMTLPESSGNLVLHPSRPPLTSECFKQKFSTSSSSDPSTSSTLLSIPSPPTLPLKENPLHAFSSDQLEEIARHYGMQFVPKHPRISSSKPCKSCIYVLTHIHSLN
jgi:hypothetical protein